jgi:hypothetical protein
VTAPGDGDGFRMAGAYVELTIRDETAKGEEEARARIEGEKPVEIPTKLADPTGDPYADADAKIKALGALKIATEASNPIDDAWRAKVEAAIKSTAKDSLQIPLEPDSELYRRKVAAMLEELQAEVKQGIPAGIAEADKYKLAVEALVREVDETIKASIKVEVDPASAAKFEAEVQALKDMAARAGGGGGPPTPGGGAGSAAGAAGGGGGGLGFAGAIGAGAAVAAGAVGGAALLMAPALLAAIGVAAEKSNTQVAAAFTGMEQAAKTSLQAGFAPFVPVLVSIADQAKTTVTSMEPDFQSAAQATAPLLNAVSTGLLTAVKEGVGASVPIIQGLGGVANAAGQGFVQLERGIGGFLQNLDVGQSAAGFTALFGAVEQILPAAGSLLSTIMPLGNALLSVLGPAVRDTMSDLSALKPVTEAVGAVLSALGPDVALYGPIFLGAMGATKLLTGSFTDFGGAATKLKSIMQDANGEFDKGQSTLNSLAKVIGINTQSAQDAAVADAKLAATKAALTAEVDKAAVAAKTEALAQAELTGTTGEAAKAQLALIDAQTAEAASAKAAAAAQKTLTEAEDASTFSFGPLGAAIAGIGLLLAPFVLNMLSSSAATNAMAGELGKLQQAASDTQSLAHLFQTDPQAEQQLATLQKYGVTLKDLADANNGNADAQQKVTDASRQALDVINAKVAADQKQLDAAGIAAAGLDEATGATTELTDAQQNATNVLNADTAARDDANTTYSDAKKQLEATTAAQQAQGAATAQSASRQQEATSIAGALGISIDTVTRALNSYAGGAAFAMTASEKLSDQFLTQELAVHTANEAIGTYFKTANAGVVSASQSLSDAEHSAAQSADAVASAQHSLVQSAQAVVTAQQGVVTAERAVADALANVTIAQNNVTKAEVADQQAQVNLTLARQQAIETLKSLHLQLADQVTSEESARVALFDQQRQSAGLGITLDNAAAIAAQDVTATNEGKVNAAIALLKAQQAVSDALNSGSNLRNQVTAADKAGVDGAPGVISAQQAIASANDQVTSANQALLKAQQAVSDAQANVIKAEQGVTDAIYNETQARKAVADAMYNEGKQAQAVAAARVALQTAQDNDSHSMDINTAAGQRNLAMLQQLAQQLFANEDPQTAGNDLINQTAGLFNISTGAAQAYLTNLGKIPADFKFGLTAVAAADFSQLNASYATILARGANATAGLPVPHATGGPIGGIGGPTDDANLIWASRNEFMQPADSHDYYGTAFMEAIRQKKIPKDALQGLAAGGTVGDLSNALGMGALGDLYQSASNTWGVLGVPSPPAPKSLPVYVPPAIPSGGGGGNATPAQGGSAAQAQAYAQSIMGRYGWGPEQWIPWLKLGNEESGWNDNAINASSGAYGIGQALGHGHPYNLGDYVAQVDWMANYIQGRYRNPATAWAFETSHVPNWYDGGGIVPPGDTLVRNATGLPETMLPPKMGDTLNAIHAAVQGGGVATAAPPVVHHTENHYHITVKDKDTAYELATRVKGEQDWANRHQRGGT